MLIRIILICCLFFSCSFYSKSIAKRKINDTSIVDVATRSIYKYDQQMFSLSINYASSYSNFVFYKQSEFFKFWYLDAWICDLSFKSKKFFITNKIKTFQFSAHTIKSEVDDTHLKNLKNNIPENDFITWHNTNKYRIKDAKKLK